MDLSVLTKNSDYPYEAIDFKSIRAEQFLPALDLAIAANKKAIEAIKQASEPSFKNTIEALEDSSEEMEFVSSVYHNLLHACTNDELQNIANDFNTKVAAASNDMILDTELFSRIQKVYTNKLNFNLNSEQHKLLEETYLQFTRNGALLPENKKKRLREIDGELARLGPEFSKNCLKATNAFELKIENESDLSGLPDSAIAEAQQTAEEKGYKDCWVFTLQAPSLIPFLKYSDRRELREQMSTAAAQANTSGEWDNRPLVLKTIGLREERAQLLGYKTHADFVLSHRMAETPERVFAFINELLEVAKPATKKEVAELQAFADELGGPNPLMPWDFAYYSEKLKQRKFDFSEESLRPYFKLENVINGAFAVAGKLYNLSFQKSDKYPVYHPDVHVYEVVNQKNNNFIGLFYTDFFPRDNKRSGAWMTNFRGQGVFRGKERRPHVSIVCNFSKPTATKPSLLTLMEVRTLFHEFGHALHSLLSQCHYRSLAGPNVYWDFVELPSQLMENWVYEQEALSLFAHHYESKNLIPTDLIKKIKESASFQAGYMMLRQLTFAFLDMAWHSHRSKDITDVLEFEDRITKDLRVLPKIPGGNQSVSFQHIFSGGYSAGYYSYKWAEVLEADAFELFKEKGIFNESVATAFREHVLERGGTEHPMTLYKSFRGHEPDTKALLRRDQLI